VGVDGPAFRAGAVCFRLRAVGHEVERAQRAQEPPPEIPVVVRVLDHPDGDERMRQLQQHGGTAAEERHQRRVAHAANDAPGREVAVRARQAFSVRALA
jgi:hypothetical protein